MEAETRGRSCRVLLIEDDRDDYLLVRDLIADIPGQPLHLDWVSDCDAGLAALLRGDHDVCLLDFRLGRRDGLELLRQASAASCRTPIVMLTGQGEREIDVQAMQAGAADYLLKDEINPALLERTIRHAIARQRDREELRRLNAELERRVQERTLTLQRANQALREREERLEEADRRKDEFLATLAHELRNPLAPIQNAVQMLRAPELPPEQLAWARDVIQRQVDHLTRLVRDLLDVSRITTGKIALQKQPLELAQVIAHAVETSRPLIDARRQELALEIPEQPLRVEGDLVRLAQVLSNLLNNAAKFTAESGSIRVTLEPEAALVEPPARATPAWAVLRVRDTGRGIAPEMLSKVFDLFTQAQAPPGRGSDGLGIGLALVRNLVQMHGGTVEAHSEGAGTGSEFVVRLPLLAERRGVPGRPPAPAGTVPSLAAARRILVADDNRDSAESLSILLQLAGNEVRTVHDGLAAVEAAARFLPDVVLLDLGMPKLDGYDAARRIRGQAGSHNAVLIAISGWGEEEARRRTGEAGFDAHLLKPVDHDALTKLLAELCAIPRQEQQQARDLPREAAQ